MCGFVGIVGPAGPSLHGTPRPAVALDLLAHRGPDDRADWWSADRTIYLGHRRLSIIDLSPAGRQPMSNEDGSIRLVYNGEAYNFRELRGELERRGHRFRSHTDSEVVVHGYEEYGGEVVERLRGMFAFALYDAARNILLLARDRLGIKPLYYTIAAGTLYFASEIKSLLSFPAVAKEIDAAALNEYLVFGKVYSPRTMFRNIMKLPAGSLARWSGEGALEIRSYWNPYAHSAELSGGAEESWYSGRLLELLEESVRLRMISDVPVGVFLSGGVDSTTNVALMSRVSGGKVHTFTAGFQGQAAYDEREWARRAAAHFGTLHEEIEVTPRDLADLLPRLSWYLDEPVADPTVIPIYYVSKLARGKNAIVILNGDGGDELFCGYRKYALFLRYHPLWNALRLIPPGAKRLLAGLARRRPAVSELLERSAEGLDFYVGATTALKNVAPFRDLVDPGGEEALYEKVREGRRRFDGERRSRDYAEWLSWWGTRSEVEHVFLYRADRMGMANSIEIRVPFLDHKIVEFAMQMPQRLKHRGGEPKYILKKAVEGIVPRDFLYRKKQGFCVPIREWGGTMLNAKIAEILPKMHRDHGLFRKEFLDSLSPMLNGADPDGLVAFDLYVLATWYERWFGA